MTKHGHFVFKYFNWLLHITADQCWDGAGKALSTVVVCFYFHFSLKGQIMMTCYKRYDNSVQMSFDIVLIPETKYFGGAL